MCQVLLEIITYEAMGFLGGSDDKESDCNAGDLGSIPGSGRFPGEGNGSPLQLFLLGKFHGQRSLRATVHGVARVRHNLVTKPPCKVSTSTIIILLFCLDSHSFHNIILQLIQDDVAVCVCVTSDSKQHPKVAGNGWRKWFLSSSVVIGDPLFAQRRRR